jgi:alpha-mannosidase
MVPHFHYDPVWWNTQAAYTETWATAIRYRTAFQEPGLALVKAHLEMARRDADYKFVLAELDYLKPYWDVYPEDRDHIRQLLANGRMELVGGTYNEPNTNLTSAESTIRNAIYGVSYQRDVLGGAPATAWQLDAFGHDPQFPGIMADASVTSSSWARGPFHEWGPHWVRGPARLAIAEMAAGDRPRMQFPTEFDWIAPSGRALLTCFQADHYSAGWWMDSAATLEQAELEVHRLFTELSSLAATRNVLLPVGTDYSPPNHWVTAIQRDWNARYVWPRFLTAIPREFFDAVREEMTARGRRFTPQTRDMNPIYTGKDVSFIDTKQAQRLAENTLLSAEKFATLASLMGAPFPAEAIDKAWRQLLFGAHHDGITGSESDQVYLDLLAGWREAFELGHNALDGALEQVGARIDTTGDGRAVTVFNPMSWPRTDVARVETDEPARLQVRDETGAAVPVLIEDDAVSFIARDVPALGYRTYRLVDAAGPVEDRGWVVADGLSIANDDFSVRADPARGGALVSVVDERTGKEFVPGGRAANELLEYREYPTHPLFAEGPWHLTPDGRVVGSADAPARVRTESSPIGQRIVVEGEFEGCRREQQVTLWDGVDRVEFTTRLHGYAGHDRLYRVRFPVDLEGGAPISEVGNAVVGRGFGFPNVDVAEVPFTLDNPAYNWFGLGATARVDVFDPASPSQAHTSRALGVAEVIAPDRASLDDGIRRLSVELVRSGVTSTVTRDDGDRYGVLHIDSNLPDVRIAIGGPSENRFVADALAASADHAAELTRQLEAQGWARVWVPGVESSPEPVAFPDLRGHGSLPILVVAGDGDEELLRALDALVEDLDDAIIDVEQPPALAGDAAIVEDYTVAVLNRGLPGFNVEHRGNLYLSLMRSCSGWPSGVWIDPPQRSAPDGSNFQFQHWSHVFEYALVGSPGDWRSAGVVRHGHEYNNPLIARVLEAHPGDLPASTGLVEVRPSSVVLTALKPSGRQLARMAPGHFDADGRVVLRLYESAGRASEVTVAAFRQLTDAETTDLLEDAGSEAEVAEGSVRLSVEPFQIVTLRARTGDWWGDGADRGRAPLVGEVAQPVFADYWLHNKGAAPTGYQPVTVQIRPRQMTGGGPFRVPVVVASERTDVPTAGSVIIDVPPAWVATPRERPYRLAPGAHLAFETNVSVADDAPDGRYFVAARITDGGQTHEDVVTIDLDRGAERSDEELADPGGRSPVLGRAIERALATAGLDARSPEPDALDDGSRGPDLEVELIDRQIRVRPGERSALRLSVRNCVASEIRGEAQLISPHDTWAFAGPWTQGFAVAPGAEIPIEFAVAPPPGTNPGTWWALVKVMYFGRLHYTESVPLEVTA